MSLAQRFERRLEGLVGGAFARVFKGQVEPVEIGTALQREAADKRNVMGNGQVHVPEPLPGDAVAVRLRAARAVGGAADRRRWPNSSRSTSTRTAGRPSATSRSTSPATSELHTGVFGVASRMESNAPPRRRPHDSLSMPVVPGVAPGDYAPQPQRSPRGHPRPPQPRAAASSRSRTPAPPPVRPAAAAAAPGARGARRRPDQPALRPARRQQRRSAAAPTPTCSCSTRASRAATSTSSSTASAPPSTTSARPTAPPSTGTRSAARCCGTATSSASATPGWSSTRSA